MLVGTKPHPKLDSTVGCPGSGDAPVGTMCQAPSPFLSTWDLLQDIAVLHLHCKKSPPQSSPYRDRWFILCYRGRFLHCSSLISLVVFSFLYVTIILVNSRVESFKGCCLLGSQWIVQLKRVLGVVSSFNLSLQFCSYLNTLLGFFFPLPGVTATSSGVCLLCS